ncbi:glycosyltransferase family 20 protein [Phanerochaete carnosa HHB-10118-sp]|uniref:Glycosyltransferase family 20 protein n=1 Tax=Phanerochaete carnosa (strain HHB-10118-sp) TaxID=650164 RepID=K5X4A6_PHACS|nr:glycosyltransferase family 20 protein [Phanerochaete carnosa HHB-10118-sp]EKM57667.1 glycosyltransferase family 20 protein [Phanerochaete carnosa HHB-10118-sp]
MDSFSEPQRRQEYSLAEVREQVRRLEEEHLAKGIELSGRIIHLTHYLPFSATLKSASSSTSASGLQPGIPSPPQTPPAKANDIPPSPSTENSPSQSRVKAGDEPWNVSVRYGHSAMVSGILSLSATHEQLFVGWTGDIHSAPSSSHINGSGSTTPSALSEPVKTPSKDVSDADKEAFERIVNAKGTKLLLKDDAISQVEEEGEPRKSVEYVPVWLDDKEAHGHYDDYCKQTLWPLFHYLLWQDVATEYASADAHWAPYVAVNEAFAKVVERVYKPGDLIWIHDYHLLLLPSLIRQVLPEAAIGLFVHTPFPSSEVFRCLPRRKEILDGMLAANLICFQTYSYSRHFVSTCVRVCGYESTSRGGIDIQGHVASITWCPVGVDAERVKGDLARPGIQPKLEALRALYAGKKIIVGRDKLDVVKGVVQKLRAFEKLLQDYPQWVGNVVLIQVTSPALTDSPKLERQVSELVAHINGEYGSLDFVPVHHYHQTIKKDEFYALLSVADLGVITPLRDGMNTTSMEFVIAQDRTNKSPLVLSEFMGISSNMTEALQINPWNLGEVAAAMHNGLTMSQEEKLQRHEKLYKVVTTHTSHTWAAHLAKLLLEQLGKVNLAKRTPFIPKNQLEGHYLKAKKRLFLFDYDGTLAPIVKVPSMATPTENTLKALTQLAEDPKNLVYIISGRDQAFLEQHLGHIKNLGMSAEHGGFIREPGSTTWRNFTENLDMSWMGEVLEIFKYYTERTTGSQIEVKKSSITWHYRSSDPEWGLFQCRQCQDLLENNLARKRPIEVLVGKKNLEVRPIAVNKGEIVKRILYYNPDAEFIFCAGDDKTDEDMFRALLLFQSPSSPKSSALASPKIVMEPPLSVTLLAGQDGAAKFGPVELAIERNAVFTTAVGHSSKRTLAVWHVTTPEEVVDHMLHLVGINDGEKSNL